MPAGADVSHMPQGVHTLVPLHSTSTIALHAHAQPQALLPFHTGHACRRWRRPRAARSQPSRATTRPVGTWAQWPPARGLIHYLMFIQINMSAGAGINSRLQGANTVMSQFQPSSCTCRDSDLHRPAATCLQAPASATGRKRSTHQLHHCTLHARAQPQPLLPFHTGHACRRWRQPRDARSPPSRATTSPAGTWAQWRPAAGQRSARCSRRRR
jgi:hypothetical protein